MRKALLGDILYVEPRTYKFEDINWNTWGGKLIDVFELLTPEDWDWYFRHMIKSFGLNNDRKF